ncbi:hypothetical protein GCK72_004357 [Caenorhabditis remanei]|uniref:Receptor L-domain domain-containing protein n=1 Tax=Caenorhabditis remanei TaxID=31234 RepID=A0A6A5HBM3_CAERE|nr:hypothetical protein GCK72_004357 [Caenorhabditis remanei]KAF1764409.1 hypothetical protein GCK72_004357 [Caenorhabditis remanei]
MSTRLSWYRTTKMTSVNTAENECYHPRCIFEHSEITSETVPFFPKCEEVCGILVFNSDTNLSEDQLENVFKNMKILNGGIRIENSRLKSLSFFTVSKKEQRFGFDCKSNRLIIRNNSLLTDVKILWKFYFFQSDTDECEIVIENNTKLDVSTLCDYGYLHSITGIKVTGNMRDCGCYNTDLNKCQVLFGGLRLINTTILPTLSPIMEIRGDILIQDTNFEDLSFLGNLERLVISDAGKKEKMTINIRNNRQMTRLGLPVLKQIKNIWNSDIFANLENLSPDFCMTIEEIILFLEYRINFVNLHAKFCEDPGNLHNLKLCYFESMKHLEQNCRYILGDLMIESGDEEYIYKLGTVTHIFGCPSQKMNALEMKFYQNCTTLSGGLILTDTSTDMSHLSKIETINGAIEISNTSLKNLDFLGSLKTVNCMDADGIMINIHSNLKMTRLGLKALKTLTSHYTFTMNLEKLQPDFCLTIPEMVVFLESSVVFRYLDARLCDFNPSELTPKTCRLTNLSSLDSNCVYLVGDLRIDSGDEERCITFPEQKYMNASIYDEGYFEYFLTALFIIVTFILLVTLGITYRRRMNLGIDKGSSTSMLVVMMAISFLISEFIYNIKFTMDDRYRFENGNKVNTQIMDMFEYVTKIVLHLIAIFHCFISFFLSSQYREVVRELLRWDKRK